MVEGDSFTTQRDLGPALAAELAEVGFTDAEEIGRGGVGVVFRAIQPELDRTVAVKVLTTESDEPNRTPFVREQRAMGRLIGHPNIVGVLQTGITRSGRPFLVMPYYRRGSLDARIHDEGALPTPEVVKLGITMAGALEAAHRLRIVHRDIKPANILFTDYREPALADFGIAQAGGAFTTDRMFAPPAFTAPEALGGATPTPASDIYGLGATLFYALTGHAAFERYSGERTPAQFLSITSEPAPDLRETGVPEPLCTVIEQAMAHNPRDRPSAAALVEQLRQVQDGLVQAGAPTGPQEAPGHRREFPVGGGELPVEVTSFVGRTRELTEVRNALSGGRLVTLTGLGGVGKTRLALAAARAAARTFPDGVRLVELAEIHDPDLVVDVVAATLGVRSYAGRPLAEALVEVLSPRTTLLVLDNCEQVIEAAAELVSALVTQCPDLTVLATSREPLELAGETVVPVRPLTTAPNGATASLKALSRVDAIALFLDRAAAAAPGFELTEENKATVAAICRRLDGLPLAIELAAARLRVLTPEQILDRMSDRFALLTRNNRGAPTRQQTLRWSIDWSYQLCTPEEQHLWSQLSVFAAFDLRDAEHVCDVGEHDLLDVLASLVDKSIVIREEPGGRVRFRLLETIREYGREKIEEAGAYPDLHRRHREWHEQLTLDAEADWTSPRQLDWVARLKLELPDLREAFEYSLTEPGDDALQIAAAMYPFWGARSLVGEGRRWLESALDRPALGSSLPRIKALHAACLLAGAQGDLVAVAAYAAGARGLDPPDADPAIRAYAAATEGAAALYSGDAGRAQVRLSDAIDAARSGGEPLVQLTLEALMLAGWSHVDGDPARALDYHERALTLARSRGEFLLRGYGLWATGVAAWRGGDADRATGLLEEGLDLTRRTGDPLMVFTCLQALAWITAGNPRQLRRAAVLMAAAEAPRRLTGSPPVLFPNLAVHQRDFEQAIRKGLGAATQHSAHREGTAMTTEAAIAYALREQPPQQAVADQSPTSLTRRERQVADLVAEGLTNQAIAAKLVISRRTAEGHVDRILTKLGFTSRTQVAAWISKQARR
ncbi:protein kinase [Rhodococcus sp. D2-41]|uniref:Protein kinase n=1 Tax=Speluncibacter jeojiensis TaxID=2710754 RepID=A0A9X4M9H7_9ACTN|nr:protein kinase [Rhodococcus sp. D2-41]MDG3009526.1 protein kinase [Rhodococcus sp. D2-41]MDG3016456.1 protein kinase [Corynebacteriales bacterium D3-21]